MRRKKRTKAEKALRSAGDGFFANLGGIVIIGQLVLGVGVIIWYIIKWIFGI